MSILERNRLMMLVVLIQLPFLILADLTSLSSSVSQTILVSLIIAVVTVLFYNYKKSSQQYSYYIAVMLVTLSALMIQVRMGQIEMHFHIFVSMAFLTIYRNWKVIMLFTITIASHHLAMFCLYVEHSLNLRDPSSIMLEISDETARFQHPHLSI